MSAFRNENCFKIQTDPPNMCSPMKKKGKRLGLWVTHYYRLEWDSVTNSPAVVVYKDEHYIQKHEDIVLTDCFVSAGEDSLAKSEYWLVLDCKHGTAGKEYTWVPSSSQNYALLSLPPPSSILILPINAPHPSPSSPKIITKRMGLGLCVHGVPVHPMAGSRCAATFSSLRAEISV